MDTLSTSSGSSCVVKSIYVNFNVYSVCAIEVQYLIIKYNLKYLNIIGNKLTTYICLRYTILENNARLKIKKFVIIINLKFIFYVDERF